MFQCVPDAVFVNRIGYVVGRGFYGIVGVAHRYSDTGMAKHADVISSVAEGHGFRPGNPQALQDGFNGGRLIVAGAVNIIALRITPGKGQLRELIGNRFNLRFIADDEQTHRVSLADQASSA